jgi:hypothetical protein
MNLYEVAEEIGRRLNNMFLLDCSMNTSMATTARVWGRAVKPASAERVRSGGKKTYFKKGRCLRTIGRVQRRTTIAAMKHRCATMTPRYPLL